MLKCLTNSKISILTQKTKFGKINHKIEFFFCSNVSYQNLRRIKNYLEILSTKNIENEMNLKDLTKFLASIYSASDYVNDKFLDDQQLQEKLGLIIAKNKNIQINFDCTEFLFKVLGRQKNDFFFKSLLSNTFSLLKKEDRDSNLLEYIANIDLGLMTVDAQLVYKSESMSQKLREITSSFSVNENYKGVNTDYILNYLSSFRTIGIDITNEDFYKYHWKNMLNSKFDFSDRIDNFTVFNYLKFFVNERKANTLNFDLGLTIKKKFKEYFENLMKINIQIDNFKSSLLESRTQDAVKLDRKFTNFRFEHLIFLIKEFKIDKKFVNLCEYCLQKKLENEICNLDLLIELAFFCHENDMMSFPILHFIAFNSIGHLRNGVTTIIFNKKILPLMDLFIASLNRLSAENRESVPLYTINSYLEEIKSCVYLNYFSASNSFNDVLNFRSLSCESLQNLKLIHQKLSHPFYDESFDNYLGKAIGFNKSVSIIKI